MAFLTLSPTGPPGELNLSSLVAGFIILVVGLAALTLRRHRSPLQSPQATRRALGYAIVYTLCVASFARIIGVAMIGLERSPWLLALADVLFVTIGLFIWVMVLAEGHGLSEYGLHRARRERLVIPTLMGLGAVVVYAHVPYTALLTQEIRPSADVLVFALLLATFGSAIPDEILFRGFLQSTLTGRTRRWARVAAPAIVFSAVRAFRYPPGLLGTTETVSYVVGVALPLGLLWGLMRELSGGSLWPSLISHVLVEFGPAAAGTSPAHT